MLLSEQKKHILNILLEGGRTWTELRSLLKVSEKTLYEHLKELQNMNLIEKDAEGKYVLTEKGFDTLRGISAPENMQLIGAVVPPQEIEKLDEIKRTIPPSLDFLAKVAPKGIVSSLVKIPFIQEFIIRYKENERLFYAFLGELYLESLKMYGPPGAKFSKELFYRIRRDVIKAALPKIYEDEVETIRLRLIIEFAPSDAFDKISRRIPDPEVRKEVVKRKKEILIEVFEKLYGIKVLESSSIQPKEREDKGITS
ncbi:MAG: ArsR family transcriptional regulator [Nitrososphaeria archaeon]